MTWSDNKQISGDHAKIFLGCLPLYYQALTYIYWGCHDKGGGWRNLTLAHGALKSYFDSQGLLPTFVESSRTGAHIAGSALNKFSEFGKAATSSLSSSKSSYASFTKELQKVTTNGNQLADECPLSALYHGASCYFQCQQIKNAKEASRSPKTIREMLYFLAALQFSPQYEALDSYFTSHFQTMTGSHSQDDSALMIPVADSGTTATGNTLSAADLKSYLLSTFLLPPSLLGWLQGPSASISDEPWLHSLFSNSQFNLSIPSSGAGIFSALSNYAYALQFQLSFLFFMCSNDGNKCGWQHCTYGKKISGSGTSALQSHICPGLTCGGKSGCIHDGTANDCNHNKYTESGGCGQSGSPSPLQAFITGALPSFGLSSSSTPNHMSDHPQGALCHTPMGFQANHLRSVGSGVALYNVLKPICGNVSSPLRQLCEKLGCLTKRAPRSLGDLFGFTWHLKGQLFPKGNQGNITDAEWLKVLIQYTPFSNNLIEEHGKNLTKFVGTDHTSHGNSTADLSSLYSSGCNEQQQNCGPYLYPLTHSDGATFGKPAPYASTYLSWMLYLIDDLEMGFQEFLHEFKNIDCSKTWCRKSATGGTQACTKPHQPGTIGTTSSGTTCSCPSVVQCGGTLPLIYRHGFRYNNPFVLMGVGNGNGDKKRSCHHFASQLTNLLQPKAPLDHLITTIDTFLYAIRWEFFSKLSGFWTIYSCLILYTFFFLLDTLHLRSRLKFNSSHVVPPLSLLTSGTPLSITKLTYITQ
ncbi:uncharacterized protein BcabD6B2_41030 [Babesia caballi]|uniref:Variant erythrocyte surface antigen-1, beta subunit n=1 Tax=Babesia caballi TaxID=5871 RepID=A0AAV4LY69_BABCB|nr:hypothetical protein, conserved [Babesia caballi]